MQRNPIVSPLLAALTLAMAFLIGGCASTSRAPADTPFVFVYLKSGPTSGQGDAETRQKMFAGHMGNIQRLANEGKLVIAGPFAKPTDKTWRGVLVLDVPTAAEAQALAATDPGVQAGEFVAESHEMRASSVLRRTGELERAMLAEAKSAAPEPGKLPPNIREYVMLTPANYERCLREIERSAWRNKIVWCGAFKPDPRGVIVLDATNATEIRAGLSDVGECAIDGWWSTKSLTGLATLPHK